ncbi:hypothetical protein SAMN05216573_12628 [Bradyrhizobium sp. Rc3b]|nr:hypothetical protein SAMN05216573_12628 [Bradyrhizobium sp. Rc3b]
MAETMKLQRSANGLAKWTLAHVRRCNDALVVSATDTSSLSRSAPRLAHSFWRGARRTGLHLNGSSRVAASQTSGYGLEDSGFTRMLMGDQYLNRASEQNRKRCKALLEWKAELVAPGRVRINERISGVSRALDGFPGIATHELIVEATADEEKGLSGSPFLDDVRNWCLNIDFGQRLDRASVGAKEVVGSCTLPCGLYNTVAQLPATALSTSEPSELQKRYQRFSPMPVRVIPGTSAHPSRSPSSARLAASYHASTMTAGAGTHDDGATASAQLTERRPASSMP